MASRFTGYGLPRTDDRSSTRRCIVASEIRDGTVTFSRVRFINVPGMLHYDQVRPMLAFTTRVAGVERTGVEKLPCWEHCNDPPPLIRAAGGKKTA